MIATCWEMKHEIIATTWEIKQEMVTTSWDIKQEMVATSWEIKREMIATRWEKKQEMIATSWEITQAFSLRLPLTSRYRPAMEFEIATRLANSGTSLFQCGGGCPRIKHAMNQSTHDSISRGQVQRAQHSQKVAFSNSNFLMPYGPPGNATSWD